MAKRKTKASPRRSQPKKSVSAEQVSALRRLRDLGFYTPKTQIRQTMSRDRYRHVIEKLRDFNDLLTNQSVALKAPKKVAKAYKQSGFTTSRSGKIIVPLQGAEGAYISKSGEVIRKSTRKGKPVREHLLPSITLSNLPEGDNIRYGVTTWQKGRKKYVTTTFKHKADFLSFLAEYTTKPHIVALSIRELNTNRVTPINWRYNEEDDELEDSSAA